jgi:hypothetical protein
MDAEPGTGIGPNKTSSAKPMQAIQAVGSPLSPKATHTPRNLRRDDDVVLYTPLD